MTQEEKTAQEAPKPTKSELESRIREAGAKGDTEALNREEATKAQEAKARVRESVTQAIADAVKPILLKSASRESLKGTGERVRIEWTPDGGPLTVAIVTTAAAPVRTSTGGGGANRPGVMRERFGRSLDQLFHEVASAEDVAKHDACTSNSARYAVKSRVVNAAIEAGRIKPSA